IRIREIIRELSDQKTTVFLSSHNLNELDRMTRHIFFLKDGQMIYRDLVEHQNFSYLIRVRDQPDFEKYQRLVSKVINQHQFIVAKDKLNQVITLLNQDGIAINDIERTQFSSENLYQEIYQDRLEV